MKKEQAKNTISKENAVFEKRKWVGVTSFCNNNCIFCLDGGHKERKHKEIEQIKSEMLEGIDSGCTRIIISGGEATIHPKFHEIIRLGKELGYKKIQTITNGRMFSNDDFLKTAVKNGLDEVTFSIHAQNQELGDLITQAKGAFRQSIKGIRNALQANIIVNADIVVNKQNYKLFPKIIDFLTKLGVMEFDILHPVPFGNAWKNKEIVLYDMKDALPYIQEGLRLAIKKGAVLWTNRFPSEFLEGLEHLIQDPYKILDEVSGRKEHFKRCLKENKPLDCMGDKCSYCYLHEFCNSLENLMKSIRNNTELGDIEIEAKDLHRINLLRSLNFKDLNVIIKENISKEKIKEFLDELSKLDLSFKIEIKSDISLNKEFLALLSNYSDNVLWTTSDIKNIEQVRQKGITFNILLTRQNIESVCDYINSSKDKGAGIYLSILAPDFNYQEYNNLVPDISKLKAMIAKEKLKEIKSSNIPPCILTKENPKTESIIKHKRKIIPLKLITAELKIDIDEFAKHYIFHKRLKRLSCKGCIKDNECTGIYQKYIMAHGFKELNKLT